MAISSLLRRGVEVVSDFQSKQPSQSQPTFHLAGWLSAFFVFTVLAFIGILFSVEYTYGLLIPTLAAVEDTNPDIYVRIDTDFDPNKPVDVADPEVEGIRPQPITNKLCTTIRHLRARAGPWSRFRGLAMYLTLNFSSLVVGSLLPFRSMAQGSYLTTYTSQFILFLVLGVLMANLELAWVHIVISEPSPKRFYQRIGGFQTWKKIVPVTIFRHGVAFGSAYLSSFILLSAFGVPDFDSAPESDGPPEVAVLRAVQQVLLLFVVVPALISFVVSIPARAIYYRVAASMLPEEDEAIVPFDRSYGGKVQPAILGGSGRLSISDAWKSLDRPALVRFTKALFKAQAIEAGVTVFFSLLITGQILAGAVTYGFAGDNA
ncbi:uncharacterized protein BO97DRAFT_368627 [Aspergillus homomorphus CBS 101889]|uniref:Ubiquitin conjugating enzyme n=1 Tax=Aspergillus homomorphus (strain CBS 101889) TaxID=1450537 RepID=A0A395HXJ5_ASPHC|nr:hypothetical protein BO97DRAFT_368627 [Aspergillus homomorphus CBS 101889]RAL12527.1 hypothetical protein BO97DRAFT_368627 [Aspergillus homomorphus CBS 101889]